MSKTEQMVSVPRELLEKIEQSWRVPDGCPADVYQGAKAIIDQGRAQLSTLLTKPAAQHQGRPTGLSQGWNLTRQSDGFVIGHSGREPESNHKSQALKDGYVYVPFMVERHQSEPVAWLNTETGNVTTSAVVVMDWGDEKEHVQSLYTRPDTGEVDRLRGRVTFLEKYETECLTLVREAEEERDTLRAQLAERDELLHQADFYVTRNAKLRNAIEAALSASAESNAPIERDQGIPGTSFQRLNMLANQGE